MNTISRLHLAKRERNFGNRNICMNIFQFPTPLKSMQEDQVASIFNSLFYAMMYIMVINLNMLCLFTKDKVESKLNNTHNIGIRWFTSLMSITISQSAIS